MTTTQARILVVEDDIGEAAYIQSALEILGYKVAATSISGEDAVRQAAVISPDLVLMDIILEGEMDGIDTAEKIQTQCDTPVIYLTAYDEDELLERARITGPFGYLLKPFSERELHSTIEMALYKHAMEKRLRESEHRYSSIFNATTDAFLITDFTGKILEVNAQACRMYGYSVNELLRRHLTDLTSNDYHHLLTQQFKTMLEHSEEFCFEAGHIRRDGTMFHVEISGAPFVYQGMRQVLNAVRDITRRKQAEEQLHLYHDRLEELVEERTAELSQTNKQLLNEIAERKQTEEALATEHNLLRTLIDNLPDYIFVKDVESRFILNNRAHARLLGAATPEELMGKTDHDIFPPEFTKQYDTSDQEILQQGQSLINREEITITPEGKKQHLLTTKVPLRSQQEEIIGFVAVCRDITQRKLAELELRSSEELLRATLESTADGILVVNKDGKITHSNTRFNEMWHVPQELIETKDDRMLLHYVLEQLAEPQTFSARVQELYQSSEQDITTLDFKDGRVFERFSCPLVQEGKIAGRVWSFRDITVFKRTEEELKTYRGHLEELVQERTTELMREIQERTRAENILHAMEQRYELAVQAANVGVWDWNLETGEIYLEPNVRHMLGYEDHEIPNDFFMWMSCIHPDDRYHVLASATAHIEGHSPLYNIEHRMVHKNGSIRWVSTKGKAFQNEHGKPERMLGTHADVTEYKQMEQKTQAAIQRLQTVIETVGDGITLSNELGYFEIFNSEMEEITGYTKDEANRSENFLAVLYPDRSEGDKAFAGIQEVREKGRSQDVETTIHTKNGIPKTLSVSTSIIPSPEGDYFLSAYHDITRRKQTEQELKHAKEAAEAANHAKSEFLANMSHELRTPLNAILGYTQILSQAKNFTAKQHRAIDVIHRSGEHLLMLINDILDLSKIEAQRVELISRDIHFPEFLKNIRDIAQIRAQQKGIHFEYDASPELPIFIQTDEKYLRQILLNLLSNAAKFTERGKVIFRITDVGGQMSAASKTHKLRFEVEDTGVGIAADQLHEIFLPFYQINKSLSHTEGTGLGLAISQRLVRMMGGRLQVNSTIGQGSRFWFELSLPEIGTFTDLSAHSPQSGPHVTGFTGPSQKILIADDKEANRMLLKELLLPLGFEAAEAIDGHDTLQKAREWHPNLILLDLVMPGMDGFEVVQRLRECSELSDVIVIAVSARVFQHTREKSLHAGCHDFVAKPFQIKELLQKLHTHLPIEWIYDPSQPENREVDSPAIDAWIMPAQHDTRLLLELAASGHIKKLLQHLETMGQLYPQSELFMEQIRQLAQRFEMNQICTFLESILQNDKNFQ